MMTIGIIFTVLMISVCSCKQAPGPATRVQLGATPQSGDVPAALPNNAFKAQITIVDPPAKLRVGQKETINVKIKNDSTVMWWARGARVNTRSDNKFYLASGNRWLKADGSLVTNM
ncbi:MAG TPA: hypothetical protein VE961_03065, partial [Pyrinomonadaceae bacterium]|nr:hypothetical protein [Pyrinomonadaceae bacterium]